MLRKVRKKSPRKKLSRDPGIVDRLHVNKKKIVKLGVKYIPKKDQKRSNVKKKRKKKKPYNFKVSIDGLKELETVLDPNYKKKDFTFEFTNYIKENVSGEEDGYDGFEEDDDDDESFKKEDVIRLKNSLMLLKIHFYLYGKSYTHRKYPKEKLQVFLKDVETYEKQVIYMMEKYGCKREELIDLPDVIFVLKNLLFMESIE